MQNGDAGKQRHCDVILRLHSKLKMPASAGYFAQKRTQCKELKQQPSCSENKRSDKQSVEAVLRKVESIQREKFVKQVTGSESGIKPISVS